MSSAQTKVQSLDKAAPLEVTSLDGNKISFLDLSKERRILLVFIRHFGCVCAKTQIHELFEVKDDLKTLNVPIVMIGSGNERFAKAYLEDSPFGKEPKTDDKPPIELYVDPSLKTFNALEMTRSVWSALKPGGLKKALSAGKKYNVSQTWGASQGDTWQLGGVFVVENGEMKYAYRNESTGDHVDLKEVLHFLRNGDQPSTSSL